MSGNQQSQHQGQQAFTLIEALVATFLFAVVLSSIMNVYLSTVKINRKTDLIRTASENARYISESISKEVRNGNIDYYSASSPCSTNLQSPNISLAIVNVDNDRFCYYQGDNVGSISSSGSNLWLVKNTFAATKVNSPGTLINNLQFYISPLYNPYTSGSRIQPRVTISASVTTTSGSQDTITIPIQTTISIPAYAIVQGH